MFVDIKLTLEHHRLNGAGAPIHGFLKIKTTV